METDLESLTVEEAIARYVGGGPSDRQQFDRGDTSTDQLADLLGLTANRVNVLVRQGHIPRVSKGRFDRREAVRGYCEHIRKQASGRGAANPELTEQKTRLAREQADKAEMQNAIARHELIPAADVEREWSAILRDVRAALLALPSRLQQRLGHLTTHDMTVFDREIRDVLSEIANGN
jgi:phage terminase Nu1 subunit (DNA packaging protein)